MLDQAEAAFAKMLGKARRVEDAKDRKIAELETKVAQKDAAQQYAEYMAAENRFGHTVDGSVPAERATAHEYEACLIAENIAYRWNARPVEYNDVAREVVAGWQKSPPHRRNLLNEHVTEIGVGVARSDVTGYCFVVQMFGRPNSLAIHVAIENATDEEVAYELDGERYSLPSHFSRRHDLCMPPVLKLATENSRQASMTLSDGDEMSIVRDRERLRIIKSR
ncbi:MAG: CAP domain-containing protein [Planctomycetia bacterium]|nr:CAP domain-containing protein [Planctomycetia bacterium]